MRAWSFSVYKEFQIQYLTRHLLHLDILKCVTSFALWPSSPDFSLGSVILLSSAHHYLLVLPGFHPWCCSHTQSGPPHPLAWFSLLISILTIPISLSTSPFGLLSSGLIFSTTCWAYGHVFGCNRCFKLLNKSLRMVFISHHLPPSSLTSTHPSLVPPVCQPLPSTLHLLFGKLST